MLPSIIIADDHSITCSGISTTLTDDLGARIVDVCADGMSAVASVTRHDPDVLILDLSLPRLNGLEVLERVADADVETRVVIFSGYADDPHILQAIRLGASAYVLKTDDTDRLVDAVRAAVHRTRYLSPSLPMTLQEVRDALDADQRVDDRYDRLTPREREVLQLVAEGQSSAVVADVLGISKRTVDKHRQNILAKLGLSSAAALIQFALQRDLIQGPQPGLRREV